MEEKKQFIIEECMLFSVQAGLQTRNKNFPVYNNKKDLLTTQREIKYQTDNTSNLKLAIFDFLGNYMVEIQKYGISEEVHIARIQKMAQQLTSQFKLVLHQGRFRIGVSQKIINLFLKYMWSLGEIPEPCHCPVDGIVKSKILKDRPFLDLVDWTRLDDIDEYKKYINGIRELTTVKNQSVAEWELENWGRR